MNLVNVNKAIAIMERVKARGDKLFMPTWQQEALVLPEALDNEEDLHTCGTGACFGGWVAVSPEFHEDGGRVESIDGSPLLGEHDDHAAIRIWLEIPNEEAMAICCVLGWRVLYGPITAADVTTEQVLEVLYRLRDTGTVYPKGVSHDL